MMLPDKIKNTPELSSLLTNIRKENPQNVRSLSKEQISLAMGKGRTWLSQVETGRLKKISSEDYIKFFEVVLNFNHDKAQKAALAFYEDFVGLNTEFSQLLQQFCSVINTQYLSCPTSYEQRNYVKFLQNLYSNFTQNHEDFEYLFDGLDLSVLNTVDELTKDTFHQKMDSLKSELHCLKKETIFTSLHIISSEIDFLIDTKSFMSTVKKANDSSSKTQTTIDQLKIMETKILENATDSHNCQTGVNLLQKLSDGCKRKLYTLEKNDLNEINTFFDTFNNFLNHFYPNLKHLTISPLTKLSIEELDNRISILQAQLNLMM